MLYEVITLQNGLSKLDQLMGISDGNETGETQSLTQPQGALVAVECNSGAVKALLGGRDYSQSEFRNNFV